MLDPYISLTCHGRVNTNILLLKHLFDTPRPSTTNSIAMDAFSRYLFTNSEEIDFPIESETSGSTTTVYCIIA